MKNALCGLIAGSLLFVNCDLSSILDTDSNPGTGLSETEIVNGLKEALVLGSKTAAFTLSDTSGTTNALGEVTGYLANELIKIALPQDVENAFTTVNQLNSTAAGQTLLAVAGVDLAEYRQAMITGLNRGAENAAGLSVNVFTTAITEMTFTSARDILFGTDSLAATSYLKTTTSGVLTAGFEPIIDSSFSRVKVNAFGMQYSVKGVWNDFAVNYNKVASAYQTLKTSAASTNPLTSLPAITSLSLLQSAGVSNVQVLNTDLTDYATGKALNGLFYMVGRQETKLRQDPMAALAAVGDFITDTVGDLLEKIFTETE